MARLWNALPFRFECLLFVMAACVRFYGIGFPNGVVFDEVHFGGFVSDYNLGKWFFDIHPPLGKLTLVWLGNAFGYNSSACVYSGIHDTYGPECKYYILRYIAGKCL